MRLIMRLSSRLGAVFPLLHSHLRWCSVAAALWRRYRRRRMSGASKTPSEDGGQFIPAKTLRAAFVSLPDSEEKKE